MIPLLLALASVARADEPCMRWSTPAEVAKAAVLVDGARRAGDEPTVKKSHDELVSLLSCVAEPLGPAEAGLVHTALAGDRPAPVPPPLPQDVMNGPPRPDDGVALVDGVPHAALRPHTPAVVQAFDGDGRVLYTRWLDGATVDRLREGSVKLPPQPSVPDLGPNPLTRSEKTRLVASAGLLAASGGLLLLAADARADWYAIDDSPAETVEELDAIRTKANIAQGAGLASAALGTAGLLTVVVRVPW